MENLSKDQIKDQAKKYFVNHPTKDIMFFTLDGMPFFKKEDAENYRLSIRQKEPLVEVKREEIMKEREAPKLNVAQKKGVEKNTKKGIKDNKGGE